MAMLVPQWKIVHCWSIFTHFLEPMDPRISHGNFTSNTGLNQWIGLRCLRENFHRKAPYEKWENRWFPVKIFPWKPIHLLSRTEHPPSISIPSRSVPVLAPLLRCNPLDLRAVPGPLSAWKPRAGPGTFRSLRKVTVWCYWEIHNKWRSWENHLWNGGCSWVYFCLGWVILW